MPDLPKKLAARLEERNDLNALRTLKITSGLIDFSSNDYLGFARSKQLFLDAHELLLESQNTRNGSGGSRLLTGNYELLERTEKQIAAFHKSEAALIFNSGYDANVGFFQAVPQRTDVILFDELCHASIRDGIGLSKAKSYKFGHNDLEDLERFLKKFKSEETDIYVVTESVFSMDGDSPQLEELVRINKNYNAYLVIDEAHALGVFGENGNGLVEQLGLEDAFFARLMTFGKGLGCHGSAILGSSELQSYLINFARSFIYTTALPPHSAAVISCAYHLMESDTESLEKLRENIVHFNREKNRLGLKPMFVYSKSAIQSAIIPGNEKVRFAAKKLQENGFDVRPILSPTVPENQERLRICIHAFNSEDEISTLLHQLSILVFGT